MLIINGLFESLALGAGVHATSREMRRGLLAKVLDAERARWDWLVQNQSIHKSRGQILECGIGFGHIFERYRVQIPDRDKGSLNWGPIGLRMFSPIRYD